MLYDYYADPPLPAMQVLCLQGSGDVLHAGKPAEAKKALQSGIALALEHKALGPLSISLVSMVNVCVTLGDHADAESYAESGKKAAEASMNAPVYVVLVEKKGVAQLAQGKRDEALATYQNCRELAELYEQFHAWKSVLGKLAKLHEEAGNDRERAACEDEPRRVEAVETARAAGVPPDPKPALEPAQPVGSA